MPTEPSRVDGAEPRERLSHMVAQREGQPTTQHASLTSGPMSSPPGQQVSPVANSPLTAPSSGGSSARDAQGGGADNLGVSGMNPAAQTRTHHSPRVAPSTPTAGGQFRIHHHLQEGGDSSYDDSHRRPQEGVSFAAAADGEKDGYSHGLGLLYDMCTLGDLLAREGLPVPWEAHWAATM